VPTIQFTTDLGFEIDIIFSWDNCVGTLCWLEVYCDVVDCAGDYSIQFYVFYSGMPSVVVYSNVFVVTVINICIPPPGCINIPGCGIPDPTVVAPIIDINIEVVVTVNVAVEIPPWSCGTPGCDTQVIVDCTINCDIGGGGVVVIVNNEINITIDSCDCNGCCGDTPDGNTIIIVIQGCIGVICEPVEVPVIIYNPCFDINLFMIQSIAIPDFDCVLYTDCVWQHNPFVVISTQAVIDVCGEINYSVDIDIDINIDINLSYDITTHTIIFYCEDMSLIDLTFEYTISVSMVLYSDCSVCIGCCTGSTGIITIITPCLNPVITIGVVIDIDFTFNGPTIWNPPPCTVDPPIC
jgi:hypothetical protein